MHGTRYKSKMALCAEPFFLFFYGFPPFSFHFLDQLPDKCFFLRLSLFRFHLLSGPLILDHQNLRHDADRDFLGRFRVQLESHWGMDFRDLFLRTRLFPSTP